ncbi:MAG: cation diffusion facilitator family transporter [Bacteroidota bacterium]|jgi:cation diffusion facilitator family transporter|nr:cation diffusion facilitator family transporter [Bacteroidota bacterium]
MKVEQVAIRTSYFSIAGNALLALAKALAGFFGNSFALIADAIESLTDVFSSTLVLLGLRYASKPADDNHPYGHGRIEPLVTFAVVGFLIISATVIAYEAIQNIGTPHETPKAWTLIVLGVIILWKEASFQIVLRRSKTTNSSSLKADAWHHRSDAITSVAAFVGITFAIVMGEGYETADDWAALFATVIILYNAFRIFRPALGELMDENNYVELTDEVRRISMMVHDVEGTEKCFVRKVGLQYQIDLHIRVDGALTVKRGHDIAHEVKDTLKAQLPQLANVHIHIEPSWEG